MATRLKNSVLMGVIAAACSCSGGTRSDKKSDRSNIATFDRAAGSSGDAQETPQAPLPGAPSIEVPLAPVTTVPPISPTPTVGSPATTALCQPRVPATGKSQAAAGGIVAVDYPVDRTVVQRGKDNTAIIKISLRALAGTACIEASTILSSDPDSHGTALAWRRLDNLQQLTNSDGSLTITGSVVQSAGGWYGLQLRGQDASGNYSPVTMTVPRVGVGEVFLVAGQSNSTNSGSADMTAYVPDDRVASASNPSGDYTGTPNTWVDARSPIPGPKDHSMKGAPWGWAGTLLRKTLQVPIGFVLVGFGGTATSQWQVDSPATQGIPAGSLLGGLVGVATNLMKYGNGFRAVLWHQGEADAVNNVSSATYEANMRAMIASFRSQTVADIPWLIAEAAWQPPTPQAAIAAVEAAQTTLRADAAAHLYPGAMTDDLITCNSVVGDGGFRDCIGSNPGHLSFLGLQVHGQRWYNALVAPGGILADTSAPQ